MTQRKQHIIMKHNSNQIFLLALSAWRWYNIINWKETCDEITAEGACVRYTADVAAVRAEVGVGEVVENDKAKEEEDNDDRQGNGDEAELLGTVPLADGDVRHEDEGGQNTKDEAAYLSEVVNVWQCAKNCVQGRNNKSKCQF